MSTFHQIPKDATAYFEESLFRTIVALADVVPIGNLMIAGLAKVGCGGGRGHGVDGDGDGWMCSVMGISVAIT